MPRKPLALLLASTLLAPTLRAAGSGSVKRSTPRKATSSSAGKAPARRKPSKTTRKPPRTPKARPRPAATAVRKTAAPSGMKSQGSKTPEALARFAYEFGLELKEKVLDEFESLSGERDRSKQDAFRKRARGTFKQAEAAFLKAVIADPGLYQGWNELGYVRRRLGKFEDALKAYEEALRLKPGYGPAIEYRGEAYLGLNRIEDAKQAYVQLVRSDRKLAAELGRAMERWLKKRRKVPAGLSPGQLRSFEDWLARREQLAAQAGEAGKGW